ncbi:hypothetical protein [Planococcus sp. YIM B11945]|uniref:hypothetical protein n=1 Tax=Planococcus sp. YIM B11945 TaxID=3435410 RepID=UPI003D7D4DA1
MKKTTLIIGTLLAAVLLAGCTEGTVIYQDKEMPISEAQERIADQLEVENPDRDLEVTIYDESDD